MTKPHLPPKVFVSYAHEDAELKRKFDVNLKVLKNEGLIDYWTDGEILPGDRWNQEITDAMNQADLIILMISNHFLVSDFIRNEELPVAIKRADQGKAVVAPVLLSKTPGWGSMDLNCFQTLPSGVVPVDDPQWRKPENAFANVEEELRKLIPTLPDKLAKQARRWRDATGQRLGEDDSGGRTIDDPAPRSRKRGHTRAWAAVIALLLVGAGITGAMLKRPRQPVEAEISPELQAWLNAPKVDRTVVEIFAAKGNGYIQNGLQLLASKNEKVAGRRLHELHWVEKDAPTRAANGLTWDFFVRGVASRITTPVYITTYFAAERSGAPNADPHRIKVDPNDTNGRLPCPADSLDVPPGFTHMGTVANELSEVWGESAISPQIFAGQNGEIPAGPQRIAIEAKIENHPVYRAVLDVMVPPHVYAQSREEWVAAVKDPKVAVSVVDQPCLWPVKDNLIWKVKLEGDPSLLKEPLAFQYYYPAEDPRSTRGPAWKVDPLANGGIGASVEIEGFNQKEFSWGPLLSSWKDGPLNFSPQLHSGARGSFTGGSHEIGFEVLSRGEPVWRGLMKLEVPAEPWSFPPEKNKLLITDAKGTDIRSAVLKAARAKPFSADPSLTTGIEFDSLRFQNQGESLTGPFVMQFHLKAARSPQPPSGSVTMSADPYPGIAIQDTPDSGGFTAVAAMSIDLKNQKGDKTLYDQIQPGFYVGGPNAAIPPGVHEIGIEMVDGAGARLYRGIIKVEVP